MLIVYNDLIRNKHNFLSYAFNTSDQFSYNFQINNKTKSQYVDCVEDLSKELFDYLIAQYTKGDSFYKYIPKRTVINVYKCCMDTKKILLSYPVFNNDLDMPEDLCFYRKNKIWFDSVDHEQEAILFNATSEDIKFLQLNDIHYLTTK